MGRPEPLPHFPESLRHDRPVVRNGFVYLVSAHERPAGGRSGAAGAVPERLTPAGTADFSPDVSASGEILAVATYGSCPWKGDFYELQTEVVVFRRSEPARRVPVSGGRGGWPAWSGDSTVFFHRVAEDGWWSVFRVDITPELGVVGPARRVTPPGIHAFTSAASRYGNRIAVATRRRESQFRHIELFDLKTEEFLPVTALVKPDFHHYNLSSLTPATASATTGSGSGGCRRRLRRPQSLSGGYAWLLPSRRWPLFQKPAAFYTSWNPAERGVIYTSVVPSSKLKILTRTDAGNNAFPSCSPDGKWIVFRSGRSGRKNLYIMDATKGRPAAGDPPADGRRLIDTMPCWSPDGELIAFSSNCHSPKDPEVFGLYLVRPDGEGLRRVPVAGPEGSEESRRERINHVCFSPTPMVAEPVGLPNQFQPYGDLFVCRTADGSGLRRLTCNSYENGTPTWVEEREDLAVDVGRLSLGGVASGDKLRGQFVEPAWLTSDL
ncbi:unnamed protein product [Spirodela intermedia]|uniref:Uncharacterized protein n=1 Tax=Spirodela intermedia TaxID=51605 RepID=A0A7I8I8J1_SPIIN|nr:unnamed protein product [Spirodela intermedia]CAA6653920.1 unnamed protein product [Spirodela intermedia]